jgi:hypothetical protein
MSLTALLAEIETSRVPLTGLELASRLGLAPAEVAAMLAALRAAGRLGPEIRPPSGPATCAAAGSCSLACPGPEECGLLVDIKVDSLTIRPAASQAVPR